MTPREGLVQFYAVLSVSLLQRCAGNLYRWRIRLVAYGARLESELGESPQGFKSPILRCKTECPLRGGILCL